MDQSKKNVKLRLLLAAVFAAALLVIIFVDFHHQIIPDVISLPGMAVGFAGSFFNSQVSWQQSALGLFFGYGILFAVAWGYYLFTKREGMGGGDLKLLGMCGAFLGWQSLLFIILFSSFTGTIVGVVAMTRGKEGGQTRIPFGPFLAAGALVFLFFHDDVARLWQAYLGMYGAR